MSNANLVKHGDGGWQEEKKMEEKDVESLLHCWMSGGIK